MKTRTWIWSVLLGGTLLGGGNANAIPEVPLRYEPQELKPAIAQSVLKVDRKESAPLRMASVNGISLADDRFAVVDKRGVPVDIWNSEMDENLEIYDYGSMSVTFYGSTVDRVSIPAEAETFRLDGVTVRISPEGIREALGNPDYIAEDGLVYRRGEALLKVFLNRKAQKITSIDYYSMAGV